MSAKTTTARLTPRERFTRGLKYSTVGPYDITRGAVGITAGTVGSSVGWLRDQYRSGRLREELETAQEVVASELAAAQQVISSLPPVPAAAGLPHPRRAVPNLSLGHRDGPPAMRGAGPSSSTKIPPAFASAAAARASGRCCRSPIRRWGG